MSLAVAMVVGLTALSTILRSEVHAQGIAFPITLLRVVDGDTLLVDAGFLPSELNPVYIRVRDIDAPEMRRSRTDRCTYAVHWAKLATWWARYLVERSDRVTIQAPGWGSYARRILATVWIWRGDTRTSLAGELLDLGIVRPFRSGKRRAWCTPDQLEHWHRNQHLWCQQGRELMQKHPAFAEFPTKACTDPDASG